MRLSDFDFSLPENLIAQTPVSPRDHSRLFVINKTDFYTFDRFIERCYNEGNFQELKIVEDFSDLDPNAIADEELEDIEDTLSMLEKYVSEIDSDSLDKPKLNKLLRSLYAEANEVE